MKEAQKVVCCKSDDPRCIHCEHSTPHVKKSIAGTFCTEWGECDLHNNKTMPVRCTRIKKEDEENE